MREEVNLSSHDKKTSTTFNVSITMHSDTDTIVDTQMTSLRYETMMLHAV